MALKCDNGFWQIIVKDILIGEYFFIWVKVLINVCGFYVDQYNLMVWFQINYYYVFFKGIYLIIDQVILNKCVFIFFVSDGRLFFVILMGFKICIGMIDIQVVEFKV